jgi:two-component system sensor histidine kinase YesM
MSYDLVQEFLKDKYRGLQLSERRYKQRTLELLALQTQINPHFLFNSLDALGWTIQEHGGQPEEAIGIIEALSDLLKYSLRQTNHSVTLAEELDQARTYAALQEYLYPDAFCIEWRINGCPEKTQAISMLLQPLIENVIQHAQTDEPGVCRLEVCTEPVEDGTLCTVRDYGRGMDPETVNRIRQQLQSSDYYTEHIGLYNTNKRLLLAFGPGSTLRIESQLGYGTEVSFCLPTTDIVQGNELGGAAHEGADRIGGGAT